MAGITVPGSAYASYGTATQEDDVSDAKSVSYEIFLKIL